MELRACCYLGQKRIAGTLNIGLLLLTFITTLWLGRNYLHYGNLLTANGQFYIDAFNLISIVLTAFVGLSTAYFSKNYMWHNYESGRINKRQLRLYHVMYQAFMLAMLLTLTANNIGIMWVAMEGATLATVLLVSLYRTPEAVEAAWKYFILCIVGIALALFGTILVYFAAIQTATTAKSAILWNVLLQNATTLNPTIMTLAFVFLLVGYGTKIGLVPLHNWLPDAHSESPAPMSTLLSGLLLNVALYALVRFKILADLALHNHLAGYLMMSFGMLSFLVAAILLHRQNNIKRLFSYSSIEHMGLMTFAFGIGGNLATFGAVLYMVVHSLTKSAIFINVGNIIQICKTQSMDKIHGLLNLNPMAGWGLLIASFAISGLPPFGIFTAELLVVIATFKNNPLLAFLLLIGFVCAFTGLIRNIQPLVFGTQENTVAFPTKIKICSSPVILHLLLVAVLGLYLPQVMLKCIDAAVKLIAV